MTLSITVPFHEGETPASAAARLARANGADRAWRFCRDMGFTLKEVVDGDPSALDRLAELGGFDGEALGAWAIRRGREAFHLRGQTLSGSSLLRTHVVACPRCLAADMADERVTPGARPYGRALWQIAGIRTCLDHHVALEEYRVLDGGDARHDITATIEPFLTTIADDAANASERAPSAFETYLRHRLVHGTNGTAWLDSLPFYAAMQVCEVIGAVAQHGPKVHLHQLDADAMWHAGAAGYAIAAEGEDGIRRFLDDLQSSFHAGRHAWGPKALFGRLYEWLAHETDDSALDPMRDVIRRHVIETMPVGPGDELFGQAITERRNHSVHSAAQAYGLHPKRLRKVLYDAGYLSDAAMALTDERAMFDATAAEPFLDRLARSVCMKGAETYLNARRPIPQMLRDHGHIRPFVAPGTANLGDYAFDPAELDRFMAQLTLRAGTDTGGLEPIATAAKRANCSHMEVVDLLVNDRLATVAEDPDSFGYAAVHVDVDEVRENVRGPEHGGIKLRDVERRMGWSTAVVRKLIDKGLLPARTAINPTNRCPQTVVDPEDLDAFDAEYVALHRLAEETGIHFKRLERRLREVGVYPDPRFKNVPATFYRRVDIALLLDL
jgi:hypothetical protein